MKYTKGDFIVVPNIHHLSGLPVSTQAIYLWICSYADKDGRCYPSKRTLGKDTGTSVKTAERQINKLIDLGLLAKTNRFVRNRQTSNSYQLLIKESGASPVTPPHVTSDVGEGGRNDAQNYTHIELNPINPAPPGDGVAHDPVDQKLLAGIIFEFRLVNPSYKRLFSRSSQRESTERLMQQHGYERLKKIVGYLPTSNANRFAPTITTPTQLENDLGKLLAWAQKEKSIKKTKIAFS